MEMALVINGKNKIITIQKPKVKHRKMWLPAFIALNKDESKIEEFMEVRESILKELTGLTNEEYDELTTDDADKILSQIEDGFLRRKESFLRESRSPQDSSQPEKTDTSSSKSSSRRES